MRHFVSTPIAARRLPRVAALSLALTALVSSRAPAAPMPREVPTVETPAARRIGPLSSSRATDFERALPSPAGAEISAAAPVDERAGWHLEVSSEEATNLFFDTETLRTRSALLFSLRLQNKSGAERRVRLTWNFSDVAGKILARKSFNALLEKSGLIARRELFEAPARGAFRWSIEAKIDGIARPLRVSLPFAVVVAPTIEFRPRSFFVVDAPANLSSHDLDFYARIGARVLRSPWKADNSGETATLDGQLRARLERNLATVAVVQPSAQNPIAATGLSAGNSTTRDLEGQWQWPRRVLSLLSRFPLVARWEIGGLEGRAQRDEFRRMAIVARPDFDGAATVEDRDAPLTPTLTLPAGSTLDWPTSPVAEVHPFVALRSAQLHAQRAHNAQNDASSGAPLSHSNAAPGAAIYFRTGTSQKDAVESDATRQRANAPAALASSLVTRYVTGIMAGASGLSASLETSPVTRRAEVSLRDEEKSAGGEITGASLNRMASSAAFAALTRRLENTGFRADLFPNSPIVRGALFAGRASSVAISDASKAETSKRAGSTVSTTENVAVMWSAPGVHGAPTRARLILHRPPSNSASSRSVWRVLDMWGNEIERSRGGALSIALQPEPIYLVFGSDIEAFSHACRAANIVAAMPLSVQLLPFTQSLRSISPANGVAAPALVPIRVRVRNLTPHPLNGVLRLSAPDGWRLAADVSHFALAGGQARIYAFLAAPLFSTAPSSTIAGREFRIDARTDGGQSVMQRQSTFTATALNWKSGQRVLVDGDLSEWHDSTWLESSPNAGEPPAKLAVRWDSTRLYIAAQSSGPSPRARRADADYLFWRGYDALQIAFGVRDPKSAERATDYGFLICPFTARNGVFEGRVLRLWSRTTPFGAHLDAQRWGGSVPGARCAVRFDARRHLTIYEASIPLEEMRDLRPAARVQHRSGAVDYVTPDGLDAPVRFGWILHRAVQPPLLWPAPAAMSLDIDPQAFLPEGAPLTSPALLGWTQIGKIATPPAHVAPAIPSSVARPLSHRPTLRKPSARKPKKPIRPRPHRSEENDSDAPPSLSPMPPNSLPPAAPPVGQPLPPRAP